MAAVKSRSLNCSNCGSPIVVRNGFKAKVAACPACDSLLDLRDEKYAVLCKLEPKKHTAKGYLCLGMKGVWKEQACEVVGRIRYRERSEGRTYVWDEWMVLTEKGRYLWIEEENGKYTAYNAFTPDSASAISEMGGPTVFVNNLGYRVLERGVARILTVEGELTWRAKVDDPVNYVEAKVGQYRLAIEYTKNEVEFFQPKRLSDAELFEIFDMKEHIAIAAEAQSARKGRSRFVGQWVVSAIIFGFFVVLMTALFLFPQRTKFAEDRYVELDQAAVDAVAHKVSMSKWTARYQLVTSVDMVSPVDGLTLLLESPSGAAHETMAFTLEDPGWGYGLGLYNFSVPESGEWTIKLKGRYTGVARTEVPSGYTLSPAPKGGAKLKWSLYKYPMASEWWCAGGFFLMFMVGIYGALLLVLLQVQRFRGGRWVNKLTAATRAMHERVRLGAAS